MAYQKLQVGLAADVITSDTIDIPLPSSENLTGATTSTTPSKLDDTNIDFTAIQGLHSGSIVVNTDTQTIATVIAVDSAHVLSLSADIFVAPGFGENYIIYLDPTANHSEGCVLYVGSAGDVKVRTTSGSEVTYVGVTTGSWMPVQVIKVFATGTTATSIIANW
jgi:hypothetical protein